MPVGEMVSQSQWNYDRWVWVHQRKRAGRGRRSEVSIPNQSAFSPGGTHGSMANLGAGGGGGAGCWTISTPSGGDGFVNVSYLVWPEGYYYPNPRLGLGTATACPGGFYCPPGATQPQLCPPGSYCPELTAFPISCPSGSYCPANSSTNITCPKGFYCPHNSSKPRPCPALFFTLSRR
jgi:hypothetical protein